MSPRWGFEGYRSLIFYKDIAPNGAVEIPQAGEIFVETK